MASQEIGMLTSLFQVTLVVRDYDEAIAYFVERLGFELLEDTPLEGGKRWVRVGPSGGQGCELLLARAVSDRQRAAIGLQAGGRVGFFVETDDFASDYERLASRGVRFTAPPRSEVYGQVVVFQDLYGNRWDLIERRR